MKNQVNPDLTLTPADQVRKLGLCVGDILQNQMPNGIDRITLLWVGNSSVMWGRSYQPFNGKQEWIDEGEIANYCEFHSFANPWVKLTEAELELEAIRELCSAAYHVLVAADGPVEMLDNLSAAAQGVPLPHSPMSGVPWVPATSKPSKQPFYSTHENAEDAGHRFS